MHLRQLSKNQCRKLGGDIFEINSNIFKTVLSKPYLNVGVNDNLYKTVFDFKVKKAVFEKPPSI